MHVYDGIMPENDYTEPNNHPKQISIYAETDYSQDSNKTQLGSDCYNSNLSENSLEIDGFTEFSPATPPRPVLASSNDEILIQQ